MLLLLSIGCALRLPSLFRLTHSHQWLFADSRGFFLREYHSNGCGKINPSNCHLQYVYWVTDMTYDPLELENWIRTRTQPFRSLFDSTRRMELSYLPFMTCVTEDDSVPEHKCKWLSLLSFQSSILQELQSTLLMLWIILLFILLSLLFSPRFRNRESFLFLSSIPSTTSRSHILLRETVVILFYGLSHREEQTAR